MANLSFKWAQLIKESQRKPKSNSILNVLLNLILLQPPKLNDDHSCECANQRKLTKQVALESSPSIFEPDNFTCQLRECERKIKTKEHVRLLREKMRKSSVSTSGRTIFASNHQESWYVFSNLILYIFNYFSVPCS